MFNSVRVRLTLWYVVLFGLLLAGFSAFVYGVLSHTLYSKFDQSLLNAAEAIAGEFRSELAEHNDNASLAARQALSEMRMPGVQFVILEGDQILASTAEGELQNAASRDFLSAAPESRDAAFRTIQAYGEEGARVAGVGAESAGRSYRVLAVEPLHDLVEELESIRRIFYVGFPASLLVAAIGGLFLAKRGFAPVVAMSNQAERISARNLHERLQLGNETDELGHLGRVFNEMLSRLDRSFEGMREFMADASHELRTPLSIIRGEADVALSQERDSAEYREALAIIQDEARRLSRIVDDLLALARADAGQRPLGLEDFYLNDLLEECCKLARVLAVNEGVALSYDSAADIPFKGDVDLLRRMLLNLLDNAIKYTPSGGSISVSLVCEPSCVRIVVADTGIGIPADSSARVFERFYRVEKSRLRADGGSGLGLAIAKWVAEAHKGSIDLISSPGHGSKFTVSLPR